MNGIGKSGFYADPISMGARYLLERLSHEDRQRLLSAINAIPVVAKDYWRNFTSDYGLPYGWARLWNLFFAALLGYAVVGVIADQKFIIPSDPSVSKKSWAKAFRLYLTAHTIYYVIEILSTRVYMVHASFAHHIVSMFLFMLLRLSPEYYSLLLFTPFYVHSLSWVLNDAESDTILSVYNFLNLVCIGYGLSVPIFKGNSVIEKFCFKHHVALILSTTLLLHSNFWSYCTAYSRNLCSKNGVYEFGINELTGVFFLSAMSNIVAITSFFSITRIRNKLRPVSQGKTSLPKTDALEREKSNRPVERSSE